MSPFFLLSFGASILGAILGSFLNALSFRFNTGKGMSGRSRCMHCGHELGALDLVPIFSFLFLRGRCRYCGSRISWQYPLVEAAAAALSVLILLAYPTSPLLFALSLVTWMTLLFIVIYDTRHQVIPWSASGLLALLAILTLVATHHLELLDFLAGPLLALPLFLLSLVSGGRWMGWGDSGLQLSLGWMLGLTAGLTGFILAFWSGALVGIVLTLFVKKVTMNSEVPFAPFLVFGAALAFFFHVDFFSSLQALL